MQLSRADVMSDIVDRIVGLVFMLPPMILFSLWIFSSIQGNKKDRYVFGMLLLGSIIGVFCAILGHIYWT